MLATIGRIAFLSSGAILGLIALLYQPEPKPDHKAYERCVQLHPQRYCGITHLGHR
jgi:hypothetical protein